MDDTDIELYIQLLKEKIDTLNDTIVEREHYNNELREENIRLKRKVKDNEN